MKIREAKPGDLEQVASDLQDIWLETQEKAGKPITELVQVDKCDRLYAFVDHDDKCLGLFGLEKRSDLPPGAMVVWMINTNEVSKRPLEFYRINRDIKKILAETPYRELRTWVGGHRKNNLKYLCKWFGFVSTGFHEPDEKSPHGYHELVLKLDDLRD